MYSTHSTNNFTTAGDLTSAHSLGFANNHRLLSVAFLPTNFCGMKPASHVPVSAQSNMHAHTTRISTKKPCDLCLALFHNPIRINKIITRLNRTVCNTYAPTPHKLHHQLCTVVTFEAHGLRFSASVQSAKSIAVQMSAILLMGYEKMAVAIGLRYARG